MTEQHTSTPALSYESLSSDPHALRVEDGPDGVVTITVPTRRTAFRYARDVARHGPGGFFLSPFAYALFKLTATRKPRAVFRMTPTDLHLLETDDDGLGFRETTRTWPLNQIGELRRNRYERGIWMTVVGRASFNLLEDVPEPMISAAGEALERARESSTREPPGAT